MATVTQLKRKRGTVYRVQIRLKRPDGTTHSEAKTFSTRAAARRWGEDREEQLRKPGGFNPNASSTATIAELIRAYLKEFEGQYERGKCYGLELISREEIGDIVLRDITPQPIIDWARNRKKNGASPSTINIYLVYLQSVLDYAQRAWGYEFDSKALPDARHTCRKSRIACSSQKRDRRPTDEELRLLLEWFDQRRDKAKGQKMATPHGDIIRFALASGRRQSEITRLRWDDLDEAKGTILVRDMKDPRGSKGNHERAALTQEALRIIKRQPSQGGSEFIFPGDSKNVGNTFNRACKMLGIEDLRFHDLRHEATSRLFEAGYQIHEVAAFTLHKSWGTLQRYTHLRPEDVALRT
ncbi:site-specific integrase [Halorhodospira halochloris]|uniref:tyrosine-type recombinase/integrase n=1 Tax=Halorhodospira halochloris TaxID=1052 RepID=UPI001EE931C0|nr:site-specific integrase [Halorhodospira halochloris]MCG5531420.1 site-specific integrase [Halorhodospira halochloris]